MQYQIAVGALVITTTLVLAFPYAAADVPERCEATLQAVDTIAEKVEGKLFEIEITNKHGWGKARTMSNAGALIERLGEYVTITGELSAAYSQLLGCVSEQE